MQTTIDRAKSGAVIEAARRAKAASGVLAQTSSENKNRAIQMIAEEIDAHAEEILEANRQDMYAAHLLVEAGQMAESLYHRLKLDQTKLGDIITGIRQVAALDDPVGRVTLARELDRGLRLYRINCPLGVIGVIFESRPDALTQIASLCIKSGNSVLLKGGIEAEHSNRALFGVIQRAAVKAGLPSDALTLLESREDVNAMLKAEGFIDLIIPRGSNALVRFVQENTVIPVLGHSEGICHVYIDRAADFHKGINITVDAKTQYPAACNSVETLLVHKEVAHTFLPAVIARLQSSGVEVRLDESSIAKYSISGVEKATEEDWGAEYSDLIIAIKVVDGIEEAIRHINIYGSHHTDSIITEDPAVFDRFFAEVDSAGVYLNASPRFADGYRYGFGAEVGISTGKLHPRGPVGLDGLVTYKYKLMGAGHTVAMYSGDNARRFTHKDIE
jgi:glutamate-5-semialdehyde dehydrogenase